MFPTAFDGRHAAVCSRHEYADADVVIVGDTVAPVAADVQRAVKTYRATYPMTLFDWSCELTSVQPDGVGHVDVAVELANRVTNRSTRSPLTTLAGVLSLTAIDAGNAVVAS